MVGKYKGQRILQCVQRFVVLSGLKYPHIHRRDTGMKTLIGLDNLKLIEGNTFVLYERIFELPLIGSPNY